MSKTLQETLELLNSKIPREDVRLRDGGGSFKLSYLEGWRVIDLLNQAFGPGNWAYGSEVTKIDVPSSIKKVDNYSKKEVELHVAHYMAKVRLIVTFPDGRTTEFIDYGYGDGQDKQQPGKAHELAIKESVTDGLKRCAKNLGHRLGLALYDKTQENVDEPEERTDQSTQYKREGGKTNGEDQKSSRIAAASPKREATPVLEVKARQESGTSGEAKDESKERADVNALIGNTSRVVVAKKTASKEELVSLLQSKYNKSDKESLTLAEAKDFLEHLRGMVK